MSSISLQFPHFYALPSLRTLELSWVAVFWIIWIHRYLRLLVHCVSHWTYRSKPIPATPSYTEKDVTVLIPTIADGFDELWPSLISIIACNPFEVILVTTTDRFAALEALAERLRVTTGFKGIKVMDCPIANKRKQECCALPFIRTKITILADDDVYWPSTILPWILAPFEDDRMGGVGTCQRVARIWNGPLLARVFNWLGAAYIQRRNFEISATHNIDGGTSCMSGRTGAYRTEIIQSPDFIQAFTDERWGKYILNTDDDNFVTRWLVNHGWKTWVQYERACEVETTLENSSVYLYQCARWARSNWRSNFTSLVRERVVWRRQPWCTYALHMATFTSCAIVVDPLLLWTCWRSTEGWTQSNRQYALGAQFVFMFGFTKVVKLMGLFLRNPSDMLYLPVSICFGYFHSLLKLYALFTINVTSWGSRKDGDRDDVIRLTPTQPRTVSIVSKDGRRMTFTATRMMSFGRRRRTMVRCTRVLVCDPNQNTGYLDSNRNTNINGGRNIQTKELAGKPQVMTLWSAAPRRHAHAGPGPKTTKSRDARPQAAQLKKVHKKPDAPSHHAWKVIALCVAITGFNLYVHLR